MNERKKRNFIILSVVFCISCLFVYARAQEDILCPSTSEQIRLGTFNIEKLGKENPYQVKNAAEILKNYDIVAIQEIMNTGASKISPLGSEGIEALRRIVSYLGDDWGYVLSPEPNGTASAKKAWAFNTFEYYAFIYRKSKIELIFNSAYLWDEEKNPIKGLRDQERQFDREPFIASFRARNGNLDFTIITIHVAAPDAGWRRDEIKRLAVVYKTVQDSDVSQNDVFLMGDFNTNVDNKEWDSLKSLPAMKHILTSKDVTTFNKKKGMLSKSQYDTIWYQGSYSDEDIIVETAEVHQAWREGIVTPGRVKLPRGIRSGESRKMWLYGRYVSDHLPVSVLMWAGRDTDSFQD